MSSFGSESLPFVVPGGQMDAWLFTGLGDKNASAAGLEFYAFLKAKVPSLRMVRRSDFTPADISKWLPNISVFDIVFDKNGVAVDAIIRLMGSSAAAIYGEHAGKSIFAHSVTTGVCFFAQAASCSGNGFGCLSLGSSSRSGKYNGRTDSVKPSDL